MASLMRGAATRPSPPSRTEARAAIAGVRALLTLGALVTAACAPPRIELVLTVPEPYAAEVSRLVVRALAPQSAAPFNCDALAFGQVDPLIAELATERRYRPIDRRGTFALEPVDRLAPKVFLVDGLAEGETRIVTACGEIGAVDRDQTLALLAEPVPSLATSGLGPIAATLGAPPPTLKLELRDAQERRVEGVAVVVTVQSASGAEMPLLGTTRAGTAELALKLPPRAGPFLAEVRPKWWDGRVAAVPGVLVRAPVIRPLPAAAADFRAGRVGQGGTPGIAVLALPGAGEAAVLQLIRDSSAPGGLREVPPKASIPGPAKLGMMDFPGRDRDVPVLVSARPCPGGSGATWVEVQPDGAHTPKCFTPPAAGVEPLALLSTHECLAAKETGAPRVVAIMEGGTSGLYRPDGTLERPLFPGQPLLPRASGCVASEDGASYRLWLLRHLGDTSGVGLTAALEQPGGRLFGPLPWRGLELGVDFPGPLEDSPRPFLATQLQGNSFTVSRVLAGVQEELPWFRILSADPVPAMPVATRGGDIDGDGHLDAVSLLEMGRQPQETAGWALWVSSAKQHRGQHIAGPVNLEGLRLQRPWLGLIDLDEDGADDIVLGDVAETPGSGSGQLAVYFMGR
ncbi:MAG: hypothetical protein HYZ28_06005 [Myxococcales bacterium]|nr:hypothetical protein [Myxococcales bacterium]